MFTMTTLGSQCASPGLRLPFRPVVIGRASALMEAPRWWAVSPPLAHELDAAHTDTSPIAAADLPGAIFTGAALAEVGGATLILAPSNAVLFHASAEQATT